MNLSIKTRTTAGLLFVFFLPQKTPDKMDVSENNGFSPNHPWINRVFRFSIIFTIHLGGFTPIFWFNTQMTGTKNRRCLGLIWWFFRPDMVSQTIRLMGFLTGESFMDERLDLTSRDCIDGRDVHPGKLTAGTQKMKVWFRWFPFQLGDV